MIFGILGNPEHSLTAPGPGAVGVGGGSPRGSGLSPRRASAAILLALVLLVVATWTARRGGPDRSRLEVAGHPAVPAKAAPAPGAEAPLPAAAAPGKPPSELPREGGAGLPPRPSLLEEGFREAKEVSWDQSLSGHVAAGSGAPGGQLVVIEWVAAIHPGTAERSRLKQTGARRDPEGVWWGRKSAVTDEAGRFSFEGLPDVRLKVHAGAEVQYSWPGQFVSLRAGNP